MKLGSNNGRVADTLAVYGEERRALQMPQTHVEAFLNSLEIGQREIARNALDYVGDETGPFCPTSPDESMDRTLGLLDVIALATCLSSDSGSMSIAIYTDDVERRVTNLMGRYGFCSCSELRLRRSHTQHHIHLARQFVHFAAMRAVLSGQGDQLDIEYACCDPATIASTAARVALALSGEILGSDREGATQMLRVALS